MFGYEKKVWFNRDSVRFSFDPSLFWSKNWSFKTSKFVKTGSVEKKIPWLMKITQTWSWKGSLLFSLANMDSGTGIPQGFRPAGPMKFWVYFSKICFRDNLEAYWFCVFSKAILRIGARRMHSQKDFRQRLLLHLNHKHEKKWCTASSEIFNPGDYTAHICFVSLSVVLRSRSDFGQLRLRFRIQVFKVHLEILI